MNGNSTDSADELLSAGWASHRGQVTDKFSKLPVV